MKQDSQDRQRAELHVDIVGGGPGPVSVKLEIVPAVLLAPMDPSKPYSTTKSEAPAIFRRHVPARAPRGVLAVPRHLAFQHHLTDTPHRVRTGLVSDGGTGAGQAGGAGLDAAGLRAIQDRLQTHRREELE